MQSLGNTNAWNTLRAATILLILLIAAHAPLALNDGLMMDDWLLLKLRPDSAVDLSFLLNGAGHPLFYGYLNLANLTGAPVLAMKLLALTGILVGAACLMLTVTRLDLLSRTEAVGFSLIVWTYPGYQIWAGKGNALYVFSFGLFFLGAWLLSLAFMAKGTRHAIFRVAAALVFFLSFALNSTIVLYAFAVLALFFAVWLGNEHTQGMLRRTFLSGWQCATRYPELVLLPLVYWGVLNMFFKRIGVYSRHYNAHLPTSSELLDGWAAFFSVGYRDVLRNSIKEMLHSPLSFAFAALLVAIGFVLLRSDVKRSPESGYRKALPFLLTPILFASLALPYLFAGLRPGSFYETRHLLLFGLPLAFGVLAVKRVAEVAVGDRAAFVVVFGLAAVASIAALWNDYFFMQARTLKQAALSTHLAAMPRPDATVFNLKDGFLDYPSPHSPFGLPEVTGMLRLAWGNRPFLGFTARAERPTILQEMEELRTGEGSAYQNIDPSGPQATITFQPGPAATPNAALVRHYYACRLFRMCDVPEFLKQLALVSIEVGPINGITPLGKAN
jgi:hypothetical protein